ncbi:MAG: CPBP family intramembrane glutamic endopeptidase [Thermoguttaceae bacterium]
MEISLLGFARNLFRGEQCKPTVVILYTVFAASFWKLLQLTTPIQNFLPGSAQNDSFSNDFLTFWIGSYRMIAAFVLFALIPALIVKFVFRENLRDYGVSLGIKARTVRSFLIMGPILFVVGIYTGSSEAMRGTYPLNEFFLHRDFLQEGTTGCIFFTLHALTYLLYYVGWEFLFRGFLQKGLHQQTGIYTAVCVQTLASTMLHYGNPGSEVIASIFAGLYWGFLVQRTRSLLSGFLQHSLLGITVDYFLIFSRK